MNIFYIGNFDKYYSTENYITHALQELGHQVHKQPVDSIKGYEELLATTDKAEPHLVLFSKPTKPYFDDYIKYCRNNRITTAAWVFDLYWSYPVKRELPVQLVKSDYVFSTDGGNLWHWESNGINHFTLRQGIHAPEAYMHLAPLKHEILFVGTVMKGSVYNDRFNLVNQIRDIYGHEETGGKFQHVNYVRGKDLNQLLGSTKIVLGHSIESPFYWSNRIYEVLGRGGFFLHPYTKGLEEEFKEGVHYVGYDRHDITDLIDKINYYLVNHEERERIRRAGHEIVRQRYTYQKRCEEMLSRIKLASDI